jgi:hypothetical protein
LAHAGYFAALNGHQDLTERQSEKDGAVTLAAIVTEGLLSPIRKRAVTQRDRFDALARTKRCVSRI